MQNLVRALLVFAGLAVVTPCHADYSPPPLFDMLGSSDLVLVGTITEVREATFVLKAETVVAGRLEGGTVEVKRFQDWTCAARWTPYAVEQRVLVCLATVRDESGASVHQIRSGGGEGEMPIDGEWVIVRGYPVKALGAAGPQNVGGVTVHGQKVRLSELVDAIRGLRRCFNLTLTRKGYPRLEAVEQIASPKELARFQASSPLAGDLAKAALSSHRLRKKPAPWTRSAVLAITDAEARKLGYDLEQMGVSFGAYNNAWRRYVAALGDSPPEVPELKGRTFWAVYYGPLRKQPGGDLWVFVDRETRKVLAVRRGQ